MRYCKHCKQEVKPKKKFNWLFFLLTCWFGIGIIYLVIYLIKPNNKCPICGKKTDRHP